MTWSYSFLLPSIFNITQIVITCDSLSLLVKELNRSSESLLLLFLVSVIVVKVMGFGRKEAGLLDNSMNTHLGFFYKSTYYKSRSNI
jgi:hypothetical protein